MGEAETFTPDNKQEKEIQEDFIPLDEIEVPMTEEEMMPLPDELKKKVEERRIEWEKKHRKK